jgi:hypothetical protein
MKTRLFHDLEAKGKNWHKKLPAVLWTLRTNVNCATRDTPLHLVYGPDTVLPPEIYLKLAQVGQFNEADMMKQESLMQTSWKKSGTKR